MNKLYSIYKELLRKYGKQNWWPTTTKNKQFEICVGAILTQNTSWKNVEKAIKNLVKNKALNKEKIKKLPAKKLAKLIRSSGYHNQKAKKLKEFVNFNKKPTRENLLEIWGLGPETVDSILLYSYNKPVFVIDAYTKRIFSRIGLCDEKTTYHELQELFHNNLPKKAKLYNEYHALIVEHAKQHCTKTKPKCGTCPLRKQCDYGKVFIAKK